MLDLLGSQYVIEHVVAEHKNSVHDKMYKIYVTDVIKCIAESMGNEIDYRFIELIDSNTVDNRTGDEIALDIIKRAGLKVK